MRPSHARRARFAIVVLYGIQASAQGLFQRLDRNATGTQQNGVAAAEVDDG